MSRRCEWCGVFVARTTELTAWRVRVGKGSRQNARSPWNYWFRLLCPSCAACTNSGATWQRTTVAECLRRRARGWSVPAYRVEVKP